MICPILIIQILVGSRFGFFSWKGGKMLILFAAVVILYIFFMRNNWEKTSFFGLSHFIL